MGKQLVLSFLLISLAGKMCAATQETERTAQAVEIKLYPMSISDFTSSVQTSFIAQIVTYTNSYCTSNLGACGLASSATFSSSEVGVSGTADNSKSMELTLYVDYPSGASLAAGATTTYVLPSSALEVILENARDDIHTDTSAYVTYIGDTYLGIPVDSTSNSIIIPIACVIVLTVSVVTVCLVRWQSNKEREERQLKRQAKKTGYGSNDNGRTTPAYKILETPPQTAETAQSTHAPRYGNGNRVRPDEKSTWNSEKQQMGAQSMTSYPRPPKVNDFRDEDDDPMTVTTNGLTHGLTPLNTSGHMTSEKTMETEAERQERRRKRKERKREKRRLREQQGIYDNDAYEGNDSDVPAFAINA